ncbi:PREDICTED: inactive TPR repeat-containing thioredoxin TTL3-like [Lupinus angustifolius]|uniref:inactive TPR repeat-containing thioredoxin TTL3-like n=1 Tax=Lupinus angustifolius TaxID=3871 RepID=UPI00092FB57D|nr:PREDICTED: inactive TPR repeat-containing thioredoxin TTL3-like [Lupinus angustifolius]
MNNTTQHSTSESMHQQGFDSLLFDHTNNKPDSKHFDLKKPSPFKLTTTTQKPIPSHRRSVSAGVPLIYSGGASTISTPSPALKPGLTTRGSTRPDVLGSGTVNYGRGSIMRRGGGSKISSNSSNSGDDNPVGVGVSMVNQRVMVGGYDPEEVKRVGNELYRNGNFSEALVLYDRAVSMSPGNAAYRSNRAAALTALGRFGEAVRECDEAVKLDRSYARAHKRLASLYLRFGQVENSRQHLFLSGLQDDQSEEQRLRLLEKHLNQCVDARKFGDWKRVLRESEAAIAVGADFSPQLVACKAEAYLKLYQFEDAESCLSNIPKLEGCPPACTQTKFFGMIGEAYVPFVVAQVEMALGRFENAVTAAEKASKLDYSDTEVAKIVNTVRMVARARSRGNDLFSFGKFSEACSAYGEGLKYDNANYVLYCNRAICWSKLGLWEQSIQDCNQALNIQPNYNKAIFRRAVSNAKLERWAEAVKDYEALKSELPHDKEVAESLRQARLALEKSRGVVYGTKFGVEVEEISALDKFKAAIASAGVSVVHFKEASNELCEEMSPFINTLCVRYPSVKFIKVDVEECLSIAKAESIRIVPTFKIYKNGEKVKEMIRPTHQILEDSVRKII